MLDGEVLQGLQVCAKNTTKTIRGLRSELVKLNGHNYWRDENLFLRGTHLFDEIKYLQAQNVRLREDIEHYTISGIIRILSTL